MKFIPFMVGGFLLFSSIACQPETPTKATAELGNSKGEIVGTAEIRRVENGVKISLDATHLPPGIHAFHVHAVGKCDPPDFKSAGGHFNPTGKQHGHKNPLGAHAGDLPNLLIRPDGIGSIDVIVPGVNLGSGKNGLFHSGGTSLVIHQDPDDDLTDPAGKAGPRIACGVIRK